MDKDVLDLLDRIKREDETAFDELCGKYSSLIDAAVHRFLPSFRKDGENGEYGEEDLRQYAAVALYRAAMTYKPDEIGKGKSVSFGLYAKICVNNALISVFRKKKSRKRKAGIRVNREDSRGTDQPAGNVSAHDPLEKLISAMDAGELVKKIEVVLSPYEKEIFMCYISGKSVSEIAERMNRDEKSVSNALYRVKVKTKGLLKNQ